MLYVSDQQHALTERERERERVLIRSTHTKTNISISPIIIINTRTNEQSIHTQLHTNIYNLMSVVDTEMERSN